MELISRKEAKEQGLKRYFTGKPCKNGHVSDRLFSNGACCKCNDAYREANKDKIADQAKAWYEANKGKVKAERKVYYEANKDKSKAYREANKGKIAAKDKAYNEANKDKVSAKNKAYHEANKDKIAARRKAWREVNPLAIFIRCSLRRIESAVGNERVDRAEVELGYTQSEFINRIESQFVDGMSWDNRSEWHVDHIKPLSVFINEGITDPAIINALDNLQPLWAKDNMSKGAKWEEECY